MATKYWMGDGGTNLWASDTCWSTTSSAGPNDTTHAVAGDDVILDVGSPNCTIAAAAACLTLSCTAYTNVLRFQQSLTVSGNVTFAATQATMTADATTRQLVLTPTTGSTLTAGGQVHPGSINFAGTSQTHVLADDWSIAGTIFTGAASTTVNGVGRTLTAANGLQPGAQIVGTATFVLTGGTWSGTTVVKNNLTLAGNVTLSGTSVAYNTGTLTYSSGTITIGTTQLNIAAAVTLDTGGMTWGTVNYTGSTATLTFNSLFLSTTLTVSSTSQPTFAGPFGFTVDTFSVVTPSTNRPLTFTQGNTYTVTTALNVNGSQYFQWTITSSSATLLTAFVLDPAATQNVAWVNATRIDSSGGQQIRSLNGVLNDPAHPTLNWDTPGTGAQWCFG